jgi:nickel-dependent lactate racemase
MDVLFKRAAGESLRRREIQDLLRQAASLLMLEGKRVLIIIPDGTRTMPMPLMFELFAEELGPRAKAVDYLVALGTHPLMSEADLSRLVGHPVHEGRYGNSRIFNHRWDLTETFADLGSIPAEEVRKLSRGLLSEAIRIQINGLLFDYDQLLICGPVFPHEVVGFSGGNKYLFPGVSTGAMIHETHWLGACLTSYHTIGTVHTPVRDLIDRAAEQIPVPVACFALVLKGSEIAGMYFGPAREAWLLAAKHSSEAHIRWLERPLRRVLAVLPDMYADLWTGAKGMYKTEPAIETGGEVILYAPHITLASRTHQKVLDDVGYHSLDYFLKQWDRFSHLPRGVLAHSTHLYGQGSYDAQSGREEPRIRVTLATAIPEEHCRRLNLNYMDPASIRLQEWAEREGEGVALVPRAGEILYRVTP